MAQAHEASMAARISSQIAGWRRQLQDQKVKVEAAAGVAAALQSEHDALLVQAHIDKDEVLLARLADLTSRQLAAVEATLDAEVILAQIQRHVDDLQGCLSRVRHTLPAPAS